MNKHKIYGLAISSEIELPTQSKTEFAGEPDIVIIKGNLSEDYKEIEHMLHQGAVDYCSAEGNQRMILEQLDRKVSKIFIWEIGLFRVEAGRKITYHNLSDPDPYQLEKWVLNMCIGIAMMQREAIVLHGSCVSQKDHAILISGDSGSGKSTLASLMLDQGFDFVADDSVYININGNNVEATGAYPLRRLCKDVVESKGMDKDQLYAIPDGKICKYGQVMKDAITEPVNLVAVFRLMRTTEAKVSIREVLGADKIKSVISCLYNLNGYRDMGSSQVMMRQIMEVANRISVYELKRPDTDEMTTQAQMQAIIDACDDWKK